MTECAEASGNAYPDKQEGRGVSRDDHYFRLSARSGGPHGQSQRTSGQNWRSSLEEGTPSLHDAAAAFQSNMDESKLPPYDPEAPWWSPDEDK